MNPPVGRSSAGFWNTRRSRRGRSIPPSARRMGRSDSARRSSPIARLTVPVRFGAAISMRDRASSARRRAVVNAAVAASRSIVALGSVSSIPSIACKPRVAAALASASAMPARRPSSARPSVDRSPGRCRPTAMPARLSVPAARGMRSSAARVRSKSTMASSNDERAIAAPPARNVPIASAVALNTFPRTAGNCAWRSRSFSGRRMTNRASAKARAGLPAEAHAKAG